MIFKDYLESLSGEIDVYTDYEDTDSATLVWEGIRLTEYGKEKYHELCNYTAATNVLFEIYKTNQRAYRISVAWNAVIRGY